MRELSNASIKNLNKNELKTELTNRRLGTQRTKENLLDRLLIAIQDMVMMIVDQHTCTHTLNACHALPGAPGISCVCRCAIRQSPSRLRSTAF